MENQSAANATLLLPDRFNNIYAFEEIINLQEKIHSTPLTRLDFSKVTFIEPYSLIGLMLLGRNHLRLTGQKLEIINIPINIHQYLARIDFIRKGMFTITERLDDRFILKRNALSNRVIDITEIPNKERESIPVISNIIAVFRKRASHIMKYWIANSVTDCFVTVISEVCQNIFEHSLDSGYMTMQTYTMGNETTVRLVIADSGIGIRESFSRNKHIEFSSSADCINRALTTPLSSKRPFGYGLCQVNTFIERLKGSIFIRSGDASVALLYHKKAGAKGTYSFLKNDLPVFAGTQISISLTK